MDGAGILKIYLTDQYYFFHFIATPDFIYNFQTVGDFTKTGMHTIKVLSVGAIMTNKEL